MATINYANARPCGGGGHVTVAVSFNGGAARDVVYTTDEIRQPLSALTTEEREQFVLLVAKVHFAGMTRAQIGAAVNAPGGVTVTI